MLCPLRLHTFSLLYSFSSLTQTVVYSFWSRIMSHLVTLVILPHILVSSLCSAVRVDCLVSKRSLLKYAEYPFPFSLWFFTTCHVLLGFPIQPSLSRLPGSRVKNSLSTQIIAKRLLSQSYRNQVFSQTTSFHFEELSLAFIPWFMPSSSSFDKIIHDVVFVQKEEELLSIQETSSQVLVCLADSSFPENQSHSICCSHFVQAKGKRRQIQVKMCLESDRLEIFNLQLFCNPSLLYCVKSASTPEKSGFCHHFSLFRSLCHCSQQD